MRKNIWIGAIMVVEIDCLSLLEIVVSCFTLNIAMLTPEFSSDHFWVVASLRATFAS